MTLTVKQEKFCQGVAKGLTYSGAYREAYDAGKMKPETINRVATDLMKSPKITARIEKLRQRSLKRYDLTVDDIISELEEAREVAKETKTSAAMVSASMGKAKLLGMVVDNVSARISQAPTIVDDI